MSFSKRLLTQAVRTNMEPRASKLARMKKHSAKNLGLDIAELQAIIQQLLGCCEYRVDVRTNPNAPSVLTDPKEQQRVTMEMMTPFRVKEVGDDTAAKIRKTLFGANPHQREKLYQHLQERKMGLLLYALDQVLLQGEELSQDDLAEVVRLRFMTFIPRMILRMIAPLMREWTYIREPHQIRLNLPLQYSTNAAREVANIARRQRLSPNDMMGLEFFLLSCGGRPEAIEEIWAIIEDIETQERETAAQRQAESRAAAKASPAIATVSADARPETIPAKTPDAQSQTQKKDVAPPRAMSPHMMEAIRYADRLLGSSTVSKAAMEDLINADEVLGDFSFPAFARTREALKTVPVAAEAGDGQSSIDKAVRDVYGELRLMNGGVEIYAVKKPTDAVATEEIQLAIRQVCAIEHRMRRAFTDYIQETSARLPNSHELHVYDALHAALAAGFANMLDDSTVVEHDESRGRKARSDMRDTILTIIQQHIDALTTGDATNERDACCVFLTKIRDTIAYVLPLLRPSGDMPDDGRHLPESGFFRIDASWPSVTVTHLLTIGSGTRMSHVVGYEPDAPQPIRIKVSDNSGTLSLAMKNLTGAPCLPNNPVPLDAILNPKGDAVKEAYGHARIARANLQHCALAMKQAGMETQFPLMKAEDIDAHLISIVDYPGKIIEKFFLFSSKNAETLGIPTEPLSADFEQRLRAANIAMPQDPCTIRYSIPTASTEPQYVSEEQMQTRVRRFFTDLGVTVFPLPKAEAILAIAGIRLERGLRHGKAIDMNGQPRAVGNRVFNENQMPKKFLLEILLHTQQRYREPIGDLKELYRWIENGGLYEKL